MAGSVSRPFFLEERLGSSGPAIEARLWHRVDRANRENRAQTQDGRKLRRYKRSWCVERLLAWLQWFRRLVTRYEYRHGPPRLHENHAEVFESDYSYRSATMGSIFAARRAGR